MRDQPIVGSQVKVILGTDVDMKGRAVGSPLDTVLSENLSGKTKPIRIHAFGPRFYEGTS
jgi:hypothetical protein